METHIGAKHISSSLLLTARVHHPMLCIFSRWSLIAMLVLVVVVVVVVFLTENKLWHCSVVLVLEIQATAQ